MTDLDNILAGTPVRHIANQKPAGAVREEWLLYVAEELQEKLNGYRARLKAMLEDAEMLQEVVGDEPLQD